MNTKTPRVVTSTTNGLALYSPGRTAMNRKGASRPLLDALRNHRVDDKCGLAPQRRWLDYGCGKGADVIALQARFPAWEVVGYDPYQAGWDITPGGVFDVVSMTYVLNVIYGENHREMALADALRFLRPGGSIIVSTRTPEELATQGSRSDGWLWDDYGWWTTAGTYQRGLRSTEVETLLRKSGVIDITSSKTNSNYTLVVAKKAS